MGTIRMTIAISFALALSLAGASGNQTAPDDLPILQARVLQQDATIRDITREVATLLARPDAVNRSPEMKSEEARSLRVRFPGIRVSETFSAEQFVSSLRDERARLMEEQADTLWSIVLAERAKACAALKNVRQIVNDLEQSPEWAMMTLEERIAVRNTVEESRRSAMAEGDPCKPAIRPQMDDEMIGL